jgi:hypothetical protein
VVSTVTEPNSKERGQSAKLKGDSLAKQSAEDGSQKDKSKKEDKNRETNDSKTQ